MIKIYRAGEVAPAEILSRNGKAADVSGAVREIIETVRANGDRSLYAYAKKFDGAELSSLEVTKSEADEAFSKADPCLVEILAKAAKNIENFHRCQLRSGFVLTGDNGVVLGQKVLPLEKVGVYIPGGTACYPSSVLMNCIPAKLAGVGELVLTTPPLPDGSVSPNIIAAARAAGADRIIKSGGAQAVAALAYGTETVPRVDKIVGPGNIYVAEAKRQVFGQVAIDMIAGPSEILVIADRTGDPVHIAADLLSQAEHDKLASAVLVTDSPALADAVSEELEKQLQKLPRYEIARASIDSNGKIIVTGTLDEAVDIANSLAPEHLELCLDKPFDYLGRVKNAGSIFLGKYCPEALGDYFAGPNHTLPTLGTARFSSPLSVDDFVKKSSFTYYTKEALRGVYADIACFAEHEGLSAHARSVTVRFDETEGEKK